MKKRQNSRTSRTPKQPSAESNRGVGYRRPPVEHQFRPGQSGNFKGRPKGSKSTDVLVKEILDRTLEVNGHHGRVRKISVRQAILTRFAEDALKGNPKSAAFVLNRYDAVSKAQAPDKDAVTPEERDILDDFVERYLSNRGDRK